MESFTANNIKCNNYACCLNKYVQKNIYFKKYTRNLLLFILCKIKPRNHKNYTLLLRTHNLASKFSPSRTTMLPKYAYVTIVYNSCDFWVFAM